MAQGENNSGYLHNTEMAVSRIKIGRLDFLQRRWLEVST